MPGWEAQEKPNVPLVVASTICAMTMLTADSASCWAVAAFAALFERLRSVVTLVKKASMIPESSTRKMRTITRAMPASIGRDVFMALFCAPFRAAQAHCAGKDPVADVLACQSCL